MSTGQIYDYAEGGFRVFALWGIGPDGKCECDNPECIAPGKHPRSSWQATPFQDDAQLEAMEEFLISTGFGVCLDDHLVIDVDPRNDGDASLEKLNHDFGMDFARESRFVVETGGGGKHIYFTVPAGSRLMGHHKDYPGIDFKNGTTGGSFVVGCGSLHVSGMEYEAQKGFPQDIEQAPDSLIESLTRKQAANKSLDGSEVSDQEIVDALEYVDPDAPRDEWISVGMAIHDATHGEGLAMWESWSSRGTKYAGSDDLERCWHSFGKSQNPIRIGSLFKMAEQRGYSRPVTFEPDATTPIVDEQPGPAEPKPKAVKMLEALQADDDAEIRRVTNMQWLIDGLIPAEAFGVVFGEPGGGKSFSVLDMACSVSSGRPWQGLDTGDEGVVVYISAEGGNGMRIRKRAWEQVNQGAPLMRVLPITTIMDDPKDAGELGQVLREYRKRVHQPIKMIVIDTLNRSMAGNENDNSEMADFIRGCERIQADHDCGVIVVHHSGKDADKGARGASALKAATDFEIMVGKKDDIITVTHTRSKDTEALPPVVCRADVITLDGYLDYKGREITSLVPVAASMGDEMRASLQMNDREQALLDIVREQAKAAGTADGSCDRATVREEFQRVTGATNSAISQALSKNLKSLRDRGSIDFDRQEVRLM